MSDGTEWYMSCIVNITFCVFKVGDKHSILVRKVTDYNELLILGTYLFDF